MYAIHLATVEVDLVFFCLHMLFYYSIFSALHALEYNYS